MRHRAYLQEDYMIGINNYESTRDINITASPAEAVLRGIAPKGGLYVARKLNEVKVNLDELKNKSYQDRAKLILGLLLGDYDFMELGRCVDAAYARFSTPEVVPVVNAGDCFIAELFHGPTAAFKDVALCILPYLMTMASRMQGILDKEVIILTATSGDTGKAALEGFKDVKGTRIIVFYPDGGVSPVQKAQMVTQEGANTYVCAIRGNFDDAQTGVKEIFADDEFNRRLSMAGEILSSANSINVGRLVPQVVYYFNTYMEMVEKGIITQGDKINFAVPTGNFGNILAAYYAMMMGLPVNKLICASNENNVLTDFIRKGIYDKNRQFYRTISPSMDILVSSNLERFLYYISGLDNEYVSHCMKNLSLSGKYEIANYMKAATTDILYGGCGTKQEVQSIIRRMYAESHYLLDPHTATACKVLGDYRQESGDTRPCAVMATASPFKFSHSVWEALGFEPSDDEFETMQMLSAHTGVSVPANLRELARRPVIHKSICHIEEMKSYVELHGCRRIN